MIQGGDVGIINIITKKHAQHGFSGMVNLTGSTFLSRGVDFLLTQQNKSSRWYFGGGWTDRLRKSDFDQEKTTIVADTATTSHSNGPRESNNFNYSLKAGWMYTLPHTTFNVDLEGGYGGRTRTGDLDYMEERVVGSQPLPMAIIIVATIMTCMKLIFRGVSVSTISLMIRGIS